MKTITKNISNQELAYFIRNSLENKNGDADLIACSTLCEMKLGNYIKKNISEKEIGDFVRDYNFILNAKESKK